MNVRKSVLEGRTLQTWLLDVVLFGLVFLDAYLAIGIATKASQEQASPPVLQSFSKVPRVDVLNGCGISGLARQFAEYLRSQGIDVVKVGDYKRFDIEESVVVDRVGDLDAANQVAAVLGIAGSNVIQQVHQEYVLDVSIVIGKDYHGLQPNLP